MSKPGVVATMIARLEREIQQRQLEIDARLDLLTALQGAQPITPRKAKTVAVHPPKGEAVDDHR